MSALFRTWPERAPAALDIGLLPIRDRACLRLLDRYESATADQLATPHPSDPANVAATAAPTLALGPARALAADV